MLVVGPVTVRKCARLPATAELVVSSFKLLHSSDDIFDVQHFHCGGRGWASQLLSMWSALSNFVERRPLLAALTPLEGAVRRHVRLHIVIVGLHRRHQSAQRDLRPVGQVHRHFAVRVRILAQLCNRSEPSLRSHYHLTDARTGVISMPGARTVYFADIDVDFLP